MVSPVEYMSHQDFQVGDVIAKSNGTTFSGSNQPTAVITSIDIFDGMITKIWNNNGTYTNPKETILIHREDRLPEDPPKDDVCNPEHYTLGSIEVIDFIEAWELDFREGNVIKYTVRAPYKGNRLKDLEKARWYLDRLIEEEIAATTPDIKEIQTQ